ncbi:MAG: SDR family oxidoreductase [Dehalococcoidales bacterium]|nr:SDR family oxidoreductase [Dehalococcoidales bacterium]
MAQKLEGKVAVVTGGGSTSGIGRSVSKLMAAEGAKVVVADIFKDPDGSWGADRVVKEITDEGGTAVASTDGITTLEAGEKTINTAISNFGRIDILVNCAGNNSMVPISEMTDKDWDSVIDVHLKGHFSCIRAAAMHMMEQGSGSIITFSSRGAFPFPIPGMPLPPVTSKRVGNPAYTAAKAGILGMTASFCAQLGPYGITINAIMPSANTNLFPGEHPRGADLPHSASLDPDYLAPMVVYLCTDEAKEINGQFIYASGGDFCIYKRPLEPHTFTRKIGKWTIDELNEVVPKLIV